MGWEGNRFSCASGVYGTGQGHGRFPLAVCSLPHRDVCRFSGLCQLQAAVAQVETADSGNRFGELTYLTRRDGFTYPVCFDREDAFNRVNRFPSEMALQTFLLDKDNRVVAIGNPVHNPQVKELYLNIIGGKRSATTGTKQTSVSLSERDVQFGSFLMSERQERKVTLKNTGDAPLVIHGVDTSCGCTHVEYSQRPLRPGEETTLLIVYEADEAGHFHKTVDVYCNTADAPLRVVVTGEAVNN